MQLPDFSPFSPEQRQALNLALASADAGQIQWLSGFLAGASAGAVPAAGAVAAPAAAPAAALPVTIFFGTESGNSEALAEDDAALLKKKGFKVKVKSLGDTTLDELKEAQNALLVVSTWGDGEPPDAVVPFHEKLMGADAPKLDGLNFSVCALGDTSYEQFCECGKQFDKRLEELGAKRIADRVDCDVDFDETHEEWIGAVLGALEAIAPAAAPAVAAVPAAGAVAPAAAYGKKNPFPAPVLNRVLLNGEGSSKETWHLELGLEGSGMSYDAGDALALIPQNAPDVVESVLEAGGFDPSAKVSVKGAGERPLIDAMTENLDITGISPTILKKYNELAQSDKLSALLDPSNKAELKDYLWGRQIVDVLTDFPVKDLSAADFTGILRKMPPRLYSISSSIHAHPNEVHLTIASVRYNAHGRDRKGVASTYIADGLTPGDSTVGVYTHANKNFKLPKRGDTPIIMVGPGTGVAPFRSFIEERAALGEKGKNWLFFGDQHYTYDFLYQLEWQQHLKDGTLDKLDVAFSRDQKEKIYVQHRLLENSKEIFKWLEEGAHFYVCGDASRMANDVNEALIAIAMKEARLKRDAAEYYVEDLKKSKRYQRDVY
ncbi:assimilatory sulfite reductase (NADPH) flavoprotein subunit [Sulfuriroseicoccus oceanibius]|uniref:assimilatory sulfite reductase (NADPH) n=1 Tax=Sulfuriroseicoccus oceanibius TaxID=2707525 RepID=A0A6B3LCJ4_9BACT|nr:assimilatory sulfite reductase (NADPH) flavoprotein subunit [Sulfuriroseicoccus oceanibius]QQL45168.1 assimilatory sulfite reductase (NADPH) flavoprotein subunit [Sulfuriroseicoccus oceanibius]